MNSQANFPTLLKLRASFKNLAQITWSARTAEDTYDIRNPQNHSLLYETYVSLISDIEKTVIHLRQSVNAEEEGRKNEYK